MIETSTEYKTAVTADARRTHIRAVINIIDPDITLGGVSGSEQAGYSQPAQVIDEEFLSQDNFATLEVGRWILDGTAAAIPADTKKQVGYISKAIADDDGNFETPQTVTINFSGVEMLQAITIAFPENYLDGVAENFTVTCGEQTFSRSGNRSARIIITDFTAAAPTSITLSVTKWSIPRRRARIIEIFPGLHEEWTGDDIYSLSINQQANLAAAALPYGTASLSVNNAGRRFEPTSPTGIFRSIEERQGVDISIGVELPAGNVEYKKIGRFYQYSGGWKTGQNAMTIAWSLVDIVGLLADREYIPPATLPTTAEGWIASVAAQLGTNFAADYAVDPTLAAVALSPDSRENVTGKRCADILSWVAMAAGGYITADAPTGKLALRSVSTDGDAITLDDLEQYPTVSANEDLAAIIFTLHDGKGTKHTVAGNAAASSATLSIDNPFIKTAAQADAVAARILRFYGGSAIETVGRGNPASEIGDTDAVTVAKGITITARRIAQSFNFSDGVLKSCQSQLIEVMT